MTPDEDFRALKARLNERFEAVDARFSAMDRRFTNAFERIDGIDARAIKAKEDVTELRKVTTRLDGRVNNVWIAIGIPLIVLVLWLAVWVWAEEVAPYLSGRNDDEQQYEGPSSGSES